MITHIDHVVLFVEDMDEAIAFYTNKLELELAYQSKEYSEIKTGGQTTIGLHLADNVIGHGSGGATTQVSFAVDDIKAVRELLHDRGVKISRQIEEIAPGRFMFNFIDPYGNQLSCFEST